MEAEVQKEDEMILIIIDDSDKTEESEKHDKSLSNSVPAPISIKVEPVGDDHNIDPNEIFKSAVEHGEYVEIQPDIKTECMETEWLDEDFEEGLDEKEILSDDDHKPAKNKVRLNKAGKKMRKKRAPIKRKPLLPEMVTSHIAKLRKENPEFRSNRAALVQHLAELMRKRRPPAPLPNSYVFEDGMFECSYCEVKSVSENAAKRHYQHAHGSRYLWCYACGSDYRSTINLYKHEKRCRAPDAQVQLQARGVFLGRKGRSRPFLTDHKFQPTIVVPKGKETKPLLCVHCGVTYKKPAMLQAHYYAHMGLRPYQCDVCPAAYTSSNTLSKHMQTHSNKEYICDHCNKSFKMKPLLISHLNTHLPRPRFGCSVCGRRYSQRTALAVHVTRDHMQLPPPAACPVCPKRYARMSHVRSHMLKQHGLQIMSSATFYRNLPRMDLSNVQAAEIVVKSDLQTYDPNSIIEVKQQADKDALVFKTNEPDGVSKTFKTVHIRKNAQSSNKTSNNKMVKPR